MHFVRGQATGVPARVISGPWDFVGLQGACHTVIIKIAVKKISVQRTERYYSQTGITRGLELY